MIKSKETSFKEFSKKLIKLGFKKKCLINRNYKNMPQDYLIYHNLAFYLDYQHSYFTVGMITPNSEKDLVYSWSDMFSYYKKSLEIIKNWVNGDCEKLMHSLYFLEIGL
jgi:hypothetical protein